MVFYRGFFIFKVSLLFELLVVRLIGILVIPKFSYISQSRRLNSLIYRILSILRILDSLLLPL